MSNPADGAEGTDVNYGPEDLDWSALLDEEDDDSNEEDEDEVDEQDPESEGDEADDESDEDADVEGDEDTDEATEGDEPDEVEEELISVLVNGEERRVTAEELRSGYMRQADYTRKTQEVAADRDAAAAYRALEERLAADPAATIAALAAQLGINVDSTQVTELDPLEREVQELRAWRETQERQARQDAVLAELAAVKTTFDDPDLDEDALLEFAVNNGIGDLNVAYKAMTYEAKAAAKTAATEKVTSKQQKVAAKRRAPKVATGAKRSAAPRTKGASELLDIDEALAAALEELSL